MIDGAQTILSQPARRQRPSFVLTSLIDIIFLLVIFFMVSSQIAPFSLLPLAPASGSSGETPAAAATTMPVSIRILAGRVMIGGQSVAISSIGEALAGLKASDVTTILLTPSSAATVQDVVSVLEASKEAAIANVTVLSRRSAP